MYLFTFLTDPTIGWDILSLYMLCCIIGLIIFYHLVKAAVKNAIIESFAHEKMAKNSTNNKPELPANSDQMKLQQQYDKGEITFEEYKAGWNKSGAL